MSFINHLLSWTDVQVNEEMQIPNLLWFYVLRDMCLAALHSKMCLIIRLVKILSTEVTELAVPIKLEVIVP